MVPVLRDAQDMNVWQLAHEINRLANEAARDGSAKSEELSGFDFDGYVTRAAGWYCDYAGHQSARKSPLSVPNKIVERPVFVGDAIEARKLMNLSISCDHRVVDGWDAASFVQALKKLVETQSCYSQTKLKSCKALLIKFDLEC